MATTWFLDFPNTCPVTMRSFADEKTGTLELLLTKPLSLWQIVNGKFWLLLIVLAIIPTFIYVK
jgi:ABC-2 type transport system permease protein